MCLLNYFVFYVCMGILPIGMSVHQLGPEEGAGPLPELKLQMVLSCYVGAGNQAQVPARSTRVVNH